MHLRPILLFFLTGLSSILCNGLFAGENLTIQECQKLTGHVLEVARTDQSHPLYAALQKSSLPEEALQAQTEHCLKNMDQARYSCQLKAQSYAELLQCNAAPPPAQKKIETERPEKKSEAYRAEEATSFYKELKPTRSEKITATSCDQAYDHMLQIYRTAPALLELKNHAEILKSWQSESSRQAFRKRCLADFKPYDLGCILDTKDPEIIQACLLNVPPEQ